MRGETAVETERSRVRISADEGDGCSGTKHFRSPKPLLAGADRKRLSAPLHPELYGPGGRKCGVGLLR
ncbi:unnamed protein product [Caretta caretta]